MKKRLPAHPFAYPNTGATAHKTECAAARDRAAALLPEVRLERSPRSKRSLRLIYGS